MPSKLDLIGQKYGRLFVVSPGEPIRHGGQSRATWNCLCDCWTMITVSTAALRSGNTKSCGCYEREVLSAKANDLTGMVFGRLTVVDRAPNSRSGKTQWNCSCACGNHVVASATNLTSGASKSCGCIRAEMLSKRKRKHGDSHTRLYRVWKGMIERCTDCNHISYKFYGERGIKVCDEWLHYESFKLWAESHGYDWNAPRGECTIDRINVDGAYCPENCRWVSMRIQNENKRNNK